MRARNGHVVVVGAGPGGLASALLLAAAGLRVTVLERSDRVGGRTSALTGDGFRFDVGPTFFLYPRVLSEIYAAAGYDLRREIEMVRLDPQYRLVFGEGGVLDATADLDAMERRVAALAPADAPNLRRFFADNRDKLEAFRPILENPFNGPRDLFRKELLPALPWLAPWRSLDRELGRYFADPRLRLAFSFQSKYLGMSPFRCPSLFSILSFLEYEHGVFHPIGGCAAVMEATARIAGEMGVEIRLGDPVTGFDFQGRRPVAAHTAAGERIAADAFVVNADFAHAMGRLVPDRLRRRWSDRALAEKKYSCSTFMLYLGIDGVERELPHHTIYVARDYRKNLDDVERAHRLSDDPSFYVQNACVTDSTLAPRGASTLYVLVPVPHQSSRIDWRRERGPFRERVLAQLARVGLEDVERRIRFERVTTPDDWAERHAVYRGATFNLAHSLDQMLHRRPHNRFEELDGVYLVGGGTHPGSGLPVIFESARISSRLLLEELGVPVPWPAPNRAAAGGDGRAEPPELAEAV